MIDALDQVSDKPNYKTLGLLEGTLSGAFFITQAQVHIITGRLKASGRRESSLSDGGHTWTGEIKYGGPSGTPAYYGVYELYRHGSKPGFGPHDYFTGLEVFDEGFENAIHRHFDPMRGH